MIAKTDKDEVSYNYKILQIAIACSYTIEVNLSPSSFWTQTLRLLGLNRIELEMKIDGQLLYLKLNRRVEKASPTRFCRVKELISSIVE